jgi:tRNA dimethylallyltransferase
MALAKRWPIEIISMDSALVYQGMDIGSAKPSAADLSLVPHHLIDIRRLDQVYSAAEFVRDANALMGQIRERRRLPVLVGGTMLYFKALSEGLDEMPKSDPIVREALAQEAQVLGWGAMHEQLARVDPQTAARLAPGDSQRISRALEVWRITGQPLSTFQSKYKDSHALGVQTQEGDNNESVETLQEWCDGGRPNCESFDGGVVHQANGGERFLVLSLEPAKRSWLHQRIHDRFQAMLDAGFLAEVQGLVAKPEVSADLPSMKSVGYRQAYELWVTLQQKYPAVPEPLLIPDMEREVAYQHFVDIAQTATRQLAKRQLTWLRGWPQRKIIDCDDPLSQEHALNYLEHMKKTAHPSPWI